MKVGGRDSNAAYIALSAIFGVTATLYYYHGFGLSDQVEQLPLVLHALDKNYLVNDFFVHQSETSVVRLAYARLMAFLSGHKSHLPLAFFLVNAVCNVAISVITYLFAKNMFKGAAISGLYAAAAVMSVSTFDLGWNGTVYFDSLAPSAIAAPLLLAAIWAVCVNRILVAVILSVCAAIVHPLMGLETGFLLLGVHTVNVLLYKKEPLKKHIPTLLTSLLLLLLCMVVLLYPELKQPKLENDVFIYILTRFRHPHHYLPSRFAANEYIAGLLFLTASGYAYYKGYGQRQAGFSFVLLATTTVLLLLCVGGYVFTELLPSRIWSIAQVYRLLYFVKWMGLVLLSGSIALFPVSTYLRGFYMIVLVHPAVAAFAFLSRAVVDNTAMSRLSMPAKKIFDILILVSAVIVAWLLHIPSHIITYVVLVAFIVIVAEMQNNKYKQVVLVALLVWATIMFLFPENRFVSKAARGIAFRMDKIKQKLGWSSELGKDGDEIVDYVVKKTTTTDVFLTPANWGQFRILAERAIVVDFKAFPFSDVAMLEWYNRLNNCYGKSYSEGSAVIQDFNEMYHAIDDHHLDILQRQYRFSYAILYTSVPTDYEVVFANQTYKLVRMY